MFHIVIQDFIKTLFNKLKSENVLCFTQLLEYAQSNSTLINRLLDAFVQKGPIRQIAKTLFENEVQANHQFILQDFPTLPWFSALINAHIQHLHFLLNCTPIDLSQNTIDPTPYLPEVRAYLNERFTAGDQRTLHPVHQKNLKLRRLNSLARLLSFGREYSVCTAVTIVNDQLIIASNATNETAANEIPAMIQERLHQLRAMVKAVALTPTLILDMQQQRRTLDAYMRQLLDSPTSGGTSVPHPIYDQALYKWLDAMEDPESPFSDIEKELLSNALPIILTPLDVKRIGVYQSYPIKDFHAEQLIAYYVANHGGLQQETPLGVSLLCCRTCFDALQTLTPQFIVTGTHSQAFTGTLNLATKEPHPLTPKRKAPLACDTSPMDTPEQRRAKHNTARCANAPSSACSTARLLFFSHPPLPTTAAACHRELNRHPSEHYTPRSLLFTSPPLHSATTCHKAPSSTCSTPHLRRSRSPSLDTAATCEEADRANSDDVAMTTPRRSPSLPNTAAASQVETPDKTPQSNVKTNTMRHRVPPVLFPAHTYHLPLRRIESPSLDGHHMGRKRTAQLGERLLHSPPPADENHQNEHFSACTPPSN